MIRKLAIENAQTLARSESEMDEESPKRPLKPLETGLQTGGRT